MPGPRRRHGGRSAAQLPQPLPTFPIGKDGLTRTRRTEGGATRQASRMFVRAARSEVVTYLDIRQWKRIRTRVLTAGESRHAVAASERISRNTLRKMLAHEVPPRLGSARARETPTGSIRTQAETRRTSSVAAKQRWAEWLCLVERGSSQAVSASSSVAELQDLLSPAPNDPRKKLLSAMARETGFSMNAIAEHLGLSRNTVRKYLAAFDAGGVERLLARKAVPRKVDDEAFSSALFAMLHEPPSLSGYNRTTWRLQDLKASLAEKGHRASRSVTCSRSTSTAAIRSNAQ
jgi:transposase